MSKLRIADIQRGCVYDGPGVRTTVFLKGCLLNCPWCCNPEMRSFDDEILIDEKKCLFTNNIESSICLQCVRRGGNADLLSCPFGVAKKIPNKLATSDIVETLKEDLIYFKQSGGGVTFSGGEPLLYATSLLPILEELKHCGISIYLETTLCVRDESILLIKNNIDGIILDLKLQPEMLLEDVDYHRMLSKQLQNIGGIDIIYRLVYVDSMYLFRRKIVDILLDLGIRNLELLPCHNLAKEKYKHLRIANIDYTPDKDNISSFSFFLQENGIETKVLEL